MFGLIRNAHHLAPGQPVDTPQGTMPMSPVAPNQAPPQIPASGTRPLDVISGMGTVDALRSNGLVPVARPLAQWTSGPGWTQSNQGGNNPATSTTVAQPVAQAMEGNALLDMLRSPDAGIRKQALQQFAQTIRDRGRKPGPLAFGLMGLAARRGK